MEERQYCALLLITEQFLCVDKMSYLYKKNYISSGFPACSPCFLKLFAKISERLIQVSLSSCFMKFDSNQSVFLIFRGASYDFLKSIYTLIGIVQACKHGKHHGVYVSLYYTQSHYTLLECVKPIIIFSSLMCLLVVNLIHLIFYDQMYIK